MIPYEKLSVDSQRLPISFQSIQPILLRSMLRFTLIGLFVCMECQKKIISNRGTQLVARFWEQLQASLGTKLIQSSGYHTQVDGQTERTNQIIEDMLRACVIHSETSWDKYFPITEFFYNNSYQTSWKMAPFEALYGSRWHTLLCWSQAGE